MTAVFTLGYAAFEQVTSAKQGPWTDIYGLAATLYHCIAGAPPTSALERLMEENPEAYAKPERPEEGEEGEEGEAAGDEGGGEEASSDESSED